MNINPFKYIISNYLKNNILYKILLIDSQLIDGKMIKILKDLINIEKTDFDTFAENGDLDSIIIKAWFFCKSTCDGLKMLSNVGGRACFFGDSYAMEYDFGGLDPPKPKVRVFPYIKIPFSIVTIAEKCNHLHIIKWCLEVIRGKKIRYDFVTSINRKDNFIFEEYSDFREYSKYSEI